MRIGTRMAVLYLVAGLMPLMVTNIYASTTLNASANDRQMLAAERGFEQTVSFLSDKLYRVLRVADVIALDPTLNECIYSHEPTVYPLYAQISDMNTILTFLTQKRDDLDIFEISLYVREEWIYSHRAEMIVSLRAAGEQLWYQDLMQTNYHAMFCPPQTLPKEGILAVARRVRNLSDLNQVDAVLRIDFPLEEVEQILRQGCTTDGSASMLYNRQGMLVASSQPDPPAIADLDALILGAGAEKGFFPLQDNPALLVQCTYLPQTDWYLVTTLSQPDMARANLLAWAGVFALVLAAAIPSLFMAQRILRGMTGRLRRLGVHMKSVRLGQLAPTERDENLDEIGSMTDDYNYMIARMAELLEEQYRVGREARSAELLALQSQINPHFLYNTLDMLGWMARRDQTEHIQTVIKALASFYRLSLNYGKDFISLRDELRMILSYMTIQHLRFGDAISLVMDVQEQAMSCLLPKITLQPLVENALLHGILPKEHKRGTIVICGRIEGENLRLEVRDDGIGIPPERLRAMLFPVHAEGGAQGYGLHNIEKRLCLSFGLETCLSFSSEPGRGTVVGMLFPARREDWHSEGDPG